MTNYNYLMCYLHQRLFEILACNTQLLINVTIYLSYY